MNRDDFIVEMYLAGYDMASVAIAVNLTKVRVSQIIKAKGVLARPKYDVATHTKKAKIDSRVQNLFDKGVKTKPMSQILNVPYAYANLQVRRIRRLNQLHRKSD
jgi:glycyl-tRNA synthetase (class II)